MVTQACDVGHDPPLSPNCEKYHTMPCAINCITPVNRNALVVGNAFVIERERAWTTSANTCSNGCTARGHAGNDAALSPRP